MPEFQNADTPPPIAAWRTWLRKDPHRLRVLAIWGCWYGFFLLITYHSTRSLQEKARVTVPDWLTLLSATTGAVCVLALFATGLSLSKSHRILRGQLRHTLGIHTMAGILVWAPFALNRFVFESLGVHMTRPGTTNLRDFLVTFAFYAVWVAGIHAVMYIRESRRDEARALQLKMDLSEAARQRMEAELRALKSELSPRFMIDAFETISALIRVAPERAEKAIAQLGGVLRTALHRGSTREVPLHEELETLQPLVDLERARLGANLDVDVRVDEDVVDALVPDMLLQPLVTVALEGQAGGGAPPRLAIVATRDVERPDSVVITVTGSGTTFPDAQAPREGRDLPWPTTLRGRLAQLYGERSSLTISRTNEGSAAKLIVPYHDVEQELTAFEPAAFPAAPSASRRELLRALGATVAIVVSYAWIAWVNQERTGQIERIYGPELPPFFFEMQFFFGALVMALNILVPIEVNRRAPWSDDTIATSRKLLQHAGAMVGLALLHVAQKAGMSLPYGIVADRSVGHIMTLSLVSAWASAIVYAFSAGAHYLIAGIWRRMRAHRNELRLKAAMSETVRRRALAELRALQAELNPHFLGNALHAVAGLTRSSPDQAIHVLGQLCLLLRAPLTSSDTHEVSLAEELAMLHPYLEVERARIRRPLPVRWNVEQEALRGRVPQMILQPLVENAVKHGLASHSANDTAGIEVFARRYRERLEVAVSDDGCGINARVEHSAKRGPQMGVANTCARLRELYGGEASFELASRPEGGSVARFSVPWHEEPRVPASAIQESSVAHILAPWHEVHV